MDLHVTGKKLEITDPIKDYISEKMLRLPRFWDRVSEIEVVVDKTDPIHFAVEGIVHAEHHPGPFVAKVKGEDLYACVDKLYDKLERQLTDHKNKVVARSHGH